MVRRLFAGGGSLERTRLWTLERDQFPVKQGIYREFSLFRALSARIDAKMSVIIRDLGVNSLRKRTGN